MRTALIEGEEVEALDPTGCGDVFGGTLAAELVQGRTIEDALRQAVHMAARNASHRGASDLGRFLRGELVLGHPKGAV